MRPLILIYRRLDELQATRRFRLILSMVIVAMCGGIFVPIIFKSHDLDSQRKSLIAALSDQSLARNDEHALSLKNTGQVTVNGRTYGGPEFLNKPFPLFADDGHISAVNVLVDDLLANQRPTWAPAWLLERPATTWLIASLTAAWLLAIVWLEISLQFALTILATAVVVWLCWIAGAQQLMLAFAGVGLLTFTFVLLTRAALRALQNRYQVPSVAHTVLKEASRTRVALVFIILLLTLLPLVPLLLDPAAPLRFRIQTFISYSLGLTFVVAACMTLVLSCASVAFEIRDRQIWQLMTKPLRRFNYLLGKWLGVVTLNVIILAVAGVSTFTFVQYLRTLPVAPGEDGRLDLQAVNDEVLTARIGSQPRYESLSAEMLRERVRQIIENDPELSKLESVPVSIRNKLQTELQQAHLSGQRMVPPGAGRFYIFHGLQDARAAKSTLTLRYRFHILGDDEHKVFPAVFQVLDAEQRPIYQRSSRYVPTMSHSITIDPDLIQDDGTLRVAIFNVYQPPPDQPGVAALNFEAKDFELLYRVASFEGNFFRAMVVLWVKLAFLAAVGVACATFLSFPVACLLSFTVLICGVMGPYLAEAIEWYYNYEEWHDVLEKTTHAVASGIVFLLSSFGEYQPKQNLVEGRLIEWNAVGLCVAKLGVLWSTLCLGIGYLVMRTRQLAIYSGQG